MSIQFPPTLLLRRIAIRTFPGNQQIATYYCDQTKSYFSIPFQYQA